MTSNESLQAQLRFEVSSDDLNNYQQITTKRIRSYSCNSSSYLSSADSRKLSCLKHQWQYTPDSEASNEWWLFQIQSQNVAVANEQAHESLSLDIWSGEKVDSEPIIRSQMGRSLDKQAS